MKSVISQNFGRIEGRDAWRANLNLASLAADKIRSILGPKGGYKIVTYNRGPERVVKVTKDAVDVVEELGVQYPAIKIISEAAKMHREEAGDGVATFLILLSELLQGAESLLTLGVHPTKVLEGYHEAAKKALDIIDEEAVDIDDESLETVLKVVDCGRGLLTERLRHILIEATELASDHGKIDKKRIRIVKERGGSTGESRLIRGVVITKEKAHPDMPDEVEAPRIAVIGEKIGIKPAEAKMKGQGSFPIRLDIDSPGQIKEFKAEEERLNTILFEKLRSAGANVLLSRQLISEEIVGRLAKQKVFSLMNLEPDDIDAVSKAVGAKVVGDLRDLSEAELGRAEMVEVKKIGAEKIAVISGCEGITLLLRGNTPQILEELERLVRNGISVLKDTREDMRTVFGGGAVEMRIAAELRRYSVSTSGREQLAIQAFADALEAIPRCLAQNNGLDPIDTIIELNRHHANGQASMGIGTEGCSDMAVLAIKESARTKRAAIKRGYEVAQLMLRIDDFIFAKAIAKVHKK